MKTEEEEEEKIIKNRTEKLKYETKFKIFMAALQRTKRKKKCQKIVQ